MKPPFYRRKFLINKDFQFPFIARILFINLFIMGILFIGIYVIFYRFNFLGSELGFDAAHPYFRFVQEQFMMIGALFLGAALSSSLVIGVYGVFLSHRIVGPLENLKIRFKQNMDVGPEAHKTKFRKDDFFHDLAQAYNEHIDKVSSSGEEVRPTSPRDSENSED